MISYCDGCGETYKEDNLIDCSGGGSYCYRCYSERCKKNGRSITIKNKETPYDGLLPYINNHLLNELGQPSLVASVNQHGCSVYLSISNKVLMALGAKPIQIGSKPVEGNTSQLIITAFQLERYHPKIASEKEKETIGRLFANMIKEYVLVCKKLSGP
jgi:hypothetical protein